MVTVSRYHLPTVALVLLGACLAVPAGVQVADAAVVEYSHSIERVSEASVGDATVREYESLAGKPRWAFDAALSAPSGEATVRSVTRRPDAAYAGDAAAVTYVSYDGSVYRLVSTVDSGPLLGWVFGPLFLLGAGLFAVGANGFRHERPRLPAAVLSGAVTAGALLAGGAVGAVLRYRSPWVVLAMLALVGGVTAGTWRLLSPTRGGHEPEVSG